MRTAAAALLAAALGVVGLATPAQAAVSVWDTAWTYDTSLTNARPMNTPIEGSSGTSGWFKHSAPALADLDGDGKLEIAIGSLDGALYVFKSNGTLLWGGPRYLDTASPAGSIQSSPAIGDIDHDGSLDVVVGSDNGWVFAFDRYGALKPGWPQFTGWNADYPNKCATDACTGVIAPPTLADLDGDGTLEVVVGSYSHKMWAWNYRGDVLPGWPVDVYDGIASGAAVGDINGDGRPEIVVGSDVANDCAACQPFGSLHKGGLIHAFTINGHELAGWPFATDSFMHSTPALADLDGDGRLEVLAGGGLFPTEGNTRGHHLWVVGFNGQLRFSFATRGNLIGAPMVGDVTGDGRPEIALSDYSGVTYLLTATGAQMWANDGTIPVRAPNGSGAHFAAPVLADVTGDGRPEVVATDSNWHVKAFDAGTGAVVADVGTTFPVWGSAAVGDIDGDGRNEVVAGSAAQNGHAGSLGDLAGAGRLYVWRTPGVGGRVAPQFQGTRVVAPDRSLVPSNPTGSTATVYRFWSPRFSNAHFFTTSGDEARHLIDTDGNWVYEGRAFAGAPSSGESCASGSPVYRFYSPVFGSHFYTINGGEKQHIQSTDHNWTYEGVAYCAWTSQVAGSTPLYRFWSPGFGKHFFTAGGGEADYIRANDRNWNYENVAYFVKP